MAIHIIQIEKYRFACGLFWQSLSRPRDLRKEAAELARKIVFDLMVLRTDHTTAQAGFAHTRDGVRPNVFSLGAAVSKTMALEGAYYDGQQQPVHNWLGAFKLPDGMWAYFAVRDGNFLPNGDFAGTREQVLERLYSDYGLGGWNVVIGDAELESYGFHNFNAKRIQELIHRKKNGEIRPHRWWGLRQVKVNHARRLAVAGGVAMLCAGVVGGGLWHQHQKKLEEQERERAIEAARKALGPGATVSALGHPWAAKSLPQAVAQACTESLSHIAPGGWVLESYTCTADTATYSWTRNESNVNFLLAIVPDAAIDMSGDKANWSQRIVSGRGADEPLLPEKQLVESMLGRMQMLKLSPKIAKVQAPPPPQNAFPGVGSQSPPPPEWRSLTFSVGTGGLAPADVATVLELPGVRIDKLIFRGGSWSIEGVMYAK
ncbi:MAG: type 4b pilus protein PilO2 [Noviherbaspirillum sp.]